MPTAPGYRQAPPEGAPPGSWQLQAGCVLGQEWGACEDLSQPLLVTGAAGGLNLNPGHQQNNGACKQPQLGAWADGLQGRPPPLERSWGFWEERAEEGLPRPSPLPGQFIPRSAGMGHPRDFRPQQNFQGIFSSGPPWDCRSKWETPGCHHRWKELGASPGLGPCARIPAKPPWTGGRAAFA